MDITTRKPTTQAAAAAKTRGRPDDDLKPERVQFEIVIEAADGTEITIAIPSGIAAMNLRPIA